MANSIGNVANIAATNQGTAVAGPSAQDYLAKRADSVLGPQAHHSPTPAITDAGGVSGVSSDVQARQTAFLKGMKDKGIEASNPPSEAQLKQYFGTFNNKDHRGEALGQFESYNGAFNVHTANVPGHEGDEVKYGSQKNFEVKGKFYGSAAEAQKHGDYNEADTVAADNWSQVSSQRSNFDGRRVQDCKGFAFMSQDLLGAAGYQVKQVATEDGEGNHGHAMTVATDPSNGQVAVTSNDKTYRGGSADSLLRKAYGEACGDSNVHPRGFFFGDTQAHADARMAIDTDPQSYH